MSKILAYIIATHNCQDLLDITIQLTPWSTLPDKVRVAYILLVKKSPFMETESILLFSQKPTTGLLSKPDESSSRTQTIYTTECYLPIYAQVF
jgi:hypothetical protein